MIKFEDTQTPFEHSGPQGYYRVGDKYYSFKYNALYAAARGNKKITWHFNESAYTSVNWSKPSGLPILETYRLRAQQIRDKYDYLILSFSGGVDSVTMLQSFVDNGIFLDEIWCDWPRSLIDQSSLGISTDSNSDNFHSEYELNIKHHLKELEASNSKIKIHLSDVTAQSIVDDFEDTGSYYNIPVGHFLVQRLRYITRYVTKLQEQTGQRVGIIYGADKPYLRIKDNNIGISFVDSVTLEKSLVTNNSYRNIEYFYWTPDMPQLVVDQAHSMIGYLLKNPKAFEFAEFYMSTEKTGLIKRNLDYIVNQSVYPNWTNSFQTHRPPNGTSFQRLLDYYSKEKFVSWSNRRLELDRQELKQYYLGTDSGQHAPLALFQQFYPIMGLDLFKKIKGNFKK